MLYTFVYEHAHMGTLVKIIKQTSLLVDFDWVFLHRKHTQKLHNRKYVNMVSNLDFYHEESEYSITGT